MQIVITIEDVDSVAILNQLQAAYGWNGLPTLEIADKVGQSIKDDISTRAVRGKEQLDALTRQAEAKAVTDRSISVSLKP